jgi:hypothetical protein
LFVEIMQEVLLDISLFAFLPFCPLLGFFKRARRDSREKTSQNRLGEPRWQKMKMWTNYLFITY